MFRKLLTLDEARNAILQHFEPKPLGTEEIRLLDAYNRVIAEDVTAPLDIPPFNRSTVDGYAVKAEDTFGAEENSPKKLKICGTVNVGEPPKVTVNTGAAAEIYTGAPIPEGADAVVMLEHAERKGEEVYIYNAVCKNENIMKAGVDIKKGETILRKGRLLSSREIGVLAASGIITVKVYIPPRIGVLSTGVEITEPGKSLSFGKIYDVNSYTLYAAILECGGKPVYFGVFPDEENQLRKVLTQALASTDIVITSGGVSVGSKDIMPKILDSLGKPGVIFSGIATKPGKPTTAAVIEGKPIFSLPGHPTSALLIFHLLIAPAISCMSGRKSREITVRAYASTRMFPARGRRTFIAVKLSRDEENRLIAEPVEPGLSGAITTLAKADGYVEIAENQQFIEANDDVTVHLFRALDA